MNERDRHAPAWHQAMLNHVQAGIFIKDLAGRCLMSDEQVRPLRESTGEVKHRVDAAGRCASCNGASLRLLGYPKVSDLLGRDMDELIDHTRCGRAPNPRDECPIYQACRGGEATRVENDLLWRADGASFPVASWSAPERRAGQIGGRLATRSAPARETVVRLTLSFGDGGEDE